MVRMRDQLSSVGRKAGGDLTLLYAIADAIVVADDVLVDVAVSVVAEKLLLLCTADAAQATDAVAVVQTMTVTETADVADATVAAVLRRAE